MTLPRAVGLLLGDARLAAVEQVERLVDRLAHRALGLRPDVVALLEGVVDGLGEFGMRHAAPAFGGMVSRTELADVNGAGPALGLPRNREECGALGYFRFCWRSVRDRDPALAHHVMGRELPADFAQGLLSGLGHPIIGLDHLAAVVAVGCLASLQPARRGARPWALWLTMAIGAALHAARS